MIPHRGAAFSSAQQDERLHVEAQRDAARAEVERLRAKIDHARRQSSLREVLHALDGA